MGLNEPSIDFHVRLQESSLKIPLESIRRNLKGLQKLDEKQFKRTEELVKEVKSCEDKNAQKAKIKQLVNSLKSYEKRMKQAVEQEQNLHQRIIKRVQKLEELQALKESPDTKAEASENRLLKWYRDQTNLLVADYLLKNDRNIESNSGLLLLKNFQFEDLVDSDIILLSNKISSLILKKDLSALVQWINDNKSFLKKIKSTLEFETRFQEYIELIKTADFSGALKLFNEYLVQFTKTNFREIQLATGLLIFSNKAKAQQTNPNFRQYNILLSADRYNFLSDLFLKIYYKLHGIPEDDPLLVYLSIGISSLKTRSCLSSADHQALSFESILNEKLSRPEHLEQGACPVCSLEFRQLNSLLPYSHNVQSHLFESPVMLPNGNVYDRNILISAYSLGDSVTDPLTFETFGLDEMTTMFPA